MFAHARAACLTCSCCGVLDVCRADHRLLRMVAPHVSSPPAHPACHTCPQEEQQQQEEELTPDELGLPVLELFIRRTEDGGYEQQVGSSVCTIIAGVLKPADRWVGKPAVARLACCWAPHPGWSPLGNRTLCRMHDSHTCAISCPRVLQAVALFAPDQPSDDDEQPEGLAAEEVAKGIAEMIVTGGGCLLLRCLLLRCRWLLLLLLLVLPCLLVVISPVRGELFRVRTRAAHPLVNTRPAVPPHFLTPQTPATAAW